MNQSQAADPDLHGTELVLLSSERTLLSWLRLSLAMMGLGFVLDRFGLFLRVQHVEAGLSRPFTYWTGLALVVAGSIASAAAGVIHTRFRRRRAVKDAQGPRGAIALGIILSGLTTLVGAVTVVFLSFITKL